MIFAMTSLIPVIISVAISIVMFVKTITKWSLTESGGYCGCFVVAGSSFLWWRDGCFLFAKCQDTGENNNNPFLPREHFNTSPYIRMCKKGTPFSWWHFKIHFREWNVLYFDSNFTAVCSCGSSWQYVSVGSGDGLAPNRRQAISWISYLTHICGTRGRWFKARPTWLHHIHREVGSAPIASSQGFFNYYPSNMKLYWYINHSRGALFEGLQCHRPDTTKLEYPDMLMMFVTM